MNYFMTLKRFEIMWYIYVPFDDNISEQSLISPGSTNCVATREVLWEGFDYDQKKYRQITAIIVFAFVYLIDYNWVIFSLHNMANKRSFALQFALSNQVKKLSLQGYIWILKAKLKTGW